MPRIVPIDRGMGQIRSVIEGLPEPILLTDADDRIQLTNPSADALFSDRPVLDREDLTTLQARRMLDRGDVQRRAGEQPRSNGGDQRDDRHWGQCDLASSRRQPRVPCQACPSSWSHETAR